MDPIQLYIPKDQKAEIILTPQAADGGTTTIDGQASAETTDTSRASYHPIDGQVDGLHFYVEPGLEADAMDAEPAVLTLKADVRHGPDIVEKSVVFHVKTVNTQAEGFGVNIVGIVPR